MRKNLKKLVTLLLIVVLALSVFSSCKSNEEKIVGKWMVDAGSECLGGNGTYFTVSSDFDIGKLKELGEFLYLEFFDNGTYLSNQTNYIGNYSITENRIQLTGTDGSTLSYSFEFKSSNDDDDRLALATDDGYALWFDKVG